MNNPIHLKHIYANTQKKFWFMHLSTRSDAFASFNSYTIKLNQSLNTLWRFNPFIYNLGCF